MPGQKPATNYVVYKAEAHTGASANACPMPRGSALPAAVHKVENAQRVLGRVGVLNSPH